jgi:hypothetical protein
MLLLLPFPTHDVNRRRFSSSIHPTHLFLYSVHESGDVADDESADVLARKIRERWDAENKKAAEFNKSWRGLVTKHWKFAAAGGGVVLMVVLYFSWVWIWWLLKLPFQLLNIF